MPVNLTSLRDGWLELESDPGLFTLLLKDFGVKGIQVEEIYDLQKSFEGPVYGFIFLFKWIEERRSRRKVIVTDEVFVQDEPVVNSMFFAHQIVPNSCATHSLLSVLLNCDKIYLGDTLARLKEYTRHMSPENKGYAIGNTPELARAHNSHAKPEPRRIQEKPHGISTSRTVEAFHFVSYVQINNHLFELDGLKPFPIDHGPCSENEDWTEKFRRVITGRLGIATGGEPYHDIRFNLMAVVPDRRIAIEQKLRTLKINRQIVLEALQQLVKVTTPRLSCLVDKPSSKSTSGKAVATATGVVPGEGVTSTAAAKSAHTRSDDSATATTTNDASSNCSTPTKTKRGTHTTTTTTTRSTSSPCCRGGPPHPALDSHNYAKSPLTEGQMTDDSDSRPRYEQYSGSDYDSDDDEELDDTDDPGSESEETALSDRLPPPVAIHPGPGVVTGCPAVPPLASPVPLRPIHVDTKDFSRPLSIQTKFETSPTSCSSTDTSSEVGSAFNSPVRSMYFSSAQNSPNMASLKDLKRFVVIRVGGAKDTGSSASEESPDGASTAAAATATASTKREQMQAIASPNPTDLLAGKRPKAAESGNEAIAVPAAKRIRAETLQPSPRQEVSSSTCDVTSVAGSSRSEAVASTSLETAAAVAAVAAAAAASGSGSGCTAPTWPSAQASPHCKESPKYPQLIEPHQFAPKDLLALLKNIENEITICESALKDEMEKQKKYMIDHCRRTHNYDEFIGTFLAMLERNGLLNDLVERNMIVKRRQGMNVGRLHKIKVEPAKRKTRTRRRK